MVCQSWAFNLQKNSNIIILIWINISKLKTEEKLKRKLQSKFNSFLIFKWYKLFYVGVCNCRVWMDGWVDFLDMQRPGWWNCKLRCLGIINKSKHKLWNVHNQWNKLDNNAKEKNYSNFSWLLKIQFLQLLFKVFSSVILIGSL